MVPVLTKNFLEKCPAAFRSFSQVGIFQEIKCNLFNCMLSPFSEWIYSIVFLNVKELLARSRCHIWSLSDSNGIRTHNHLVRKRTLNHLAKLASLAKWLSVCLRTKWLWVRIPLLSLAAFFVGVSVFPKNSFNLLISK